MTTHEPVDLKQAENAFWAASVECRSLAELFDRLSRHLHERSWEHAGELVPRVLDSLHRLHQRIDDAGSLGVVYGEVRP